MALLLMDDDSEPDLLLPCWLALGLFVWDGPGADELAPASFGFSS